MAKVKHYSLFILLMLLLQLPCYTQAVYTITYTIVDSLEQKELPPLLYGFASGAAANVFIAGLPEALKNRGYVTASIDSVRADSLGAQVQLYLGEKYKWARLQTGSADAELLNAVRWNTASLPTTPIQFSELQARQLELLSYLEDNGHPFASVYLDSV
ncbi:MAG: hypothetical protein WKF70_04420, partial [Chitinophagaceae bacterium]